jgi:predicted nucleic acid-binding protein
MFCLFIIHIKLDKQDPTPRRTESSDFGGPRVLGVVYQSYVTVLFLHAEKEAHPGLQELLHAYLPVGRLDRLDAAMQLAQQVTTEIWPTDADDVLLARALIARYPGLAARDLVHLASCRRREIDRVRTFDRGLAAAFV